MSYNIFMDIPSLNVIIAVVEEGTATAAARRLGMTQPGVTKHIQQLEEELKRPLFDRIKKRLILNEFGHRFLSSARKVVRGAEQLKEMGDQKFMPTGLLKLGLTDAATQTIIPPRLKELRDRYPGLRFEMVVSDSEHIEEGVLRGRFDVGIISALDKSHGMLVQREIGHDRIDCVVSLEHPLASHKTITLDMLAQWPLMVYPRGSRTRAIVDDCFRERGIVPEELIDVHYNTAAVRLAEAGLGVALLSNFFIEDELPKGRLKHLRIEGDPLGRKICVIRKRGAPMSEAAHHFYKMLRGRA
jgi:DNA-binding transcriptional LysR family regulator